MILEVSNHSPILINYQSQALKTLYPNPLKLCVAVINHLEFRKKVAEAWAIEVL